MAKPSLDVFSAVCLIQMMSFIKYFLATLLLLFSLSANAQDASVSVGLIDDSNVGFTPNSSEVVSASLLRVAGEKAFSKRLSPFSQIRVSGSLELSDYNNYPLDHINIGLRAAYNRKLGLGFKAPRMSIALAGESRNYDVNLRDVFVSTVSLGLSKPISERIDLALTLSAERHRANEDQPTPEELRSTLVGNAYDLDFVVAQISSITHLDSNWSMPISLSLIDGDLISISSPNRAILARASAVNDYSEIRPDTVAYRSDGRANMVSVGLNRSLTEHTALNFLYSYQSGRAGVESKYSRDLFSLEYTINW